MKWLSVRDCRSGMWLGRKHGAPGGCWAAKLQRKPKPSGKAPPGKANPPSAALCPSPLAPAPEPDWCGWRSDSRPSRSVIANPLDLNPDPLRRDLSIPNEGYNLTLGFSSIDSSLPVMVAVCLIHFLSEEVVLVGQLRALAGPFIRLSNPTLSNQIQRQICQPRRGVSLFQSQRINCHQFSL